MQYDKQIGSFQDLTAQAKNIDTQISNAQASLKKTTATLGSIQKDPQAVSQVISSQSKAIDTAQKTQNVDGVVNALNNVEAITSKKSFIAVARDFISRLNSKILDPLRSSLETVRENISKAVQLTKDAITVRGKQFTAINQTIDAYQKQVKAYTNQINQDSKVSGFNSSNNFNINGQFTTAQIGRAHV